MRSGAGLRDFRSGRIGQSSRAVHPLAGPARDAAASKRRIQPKRKNHRPARWLSLGTSCGSARARGDEATLREAKRQPLIEDCNVRPGTACLCTAVSVLAQDRRLSKRLRPPSGLSWAATTASTGRLVSTATNRAQPVTGTIALTSGGAAARVIAMPRRQSPAAHLPGRLQRRLSASSAAGGASCDGVGLLTPVLLLRQGRGHQARAHRGMDDTRSSASSWAAASLREATAAIEGATSIEDRLRAFARSFRACSKSTVGQTLSRFCNRPISAAPRRSLA